MKSTPEVLLVYPPVMRKFAASDPPFGLMYLAAVLRDAGIGVEILDLNRSRLSDDEVKRHFTENHYPIVGIGGMTTVYYYVKWLSSFIKETSPETRLIGGGSFASTSPHIVLSNTKLEAICIGEGEPIIVELITRLLSRQSIEKLRGIAFKDGSGRIVTTPPRDRIKDLDTLPLPAYDLVDMRYYLNSTAKRPSLMRMADRHGIPIDSISNPFIMFTSRGCPFSCTFCYRNFGNRVAHHSVDYVLRHVNHVRHRYGVNNIAFYDETFNSDRRWVSEFCHKARVETPGTYYWVGGARADLLDEELVREMHDASFYEVSVGVESFDDRVLKEMGKRLSSQELSTALGLLKQYEMAPSYLGMLYGFPGDDEESLRKSVETIRDLGLNAYWQFPLPFPGTTLYEQLKKDGRIEDEEKFMLSMADHMTQDLFINLSRFPNEQLVQMVRDAEAEFAPQAKPDSNNGPSPHQRDQSVVRQLISRWIQIAKHAMSLLQTKAPR